MTVKGDLTAGEMLAAVLPVGGAAMFARPPGPERATFVLTLDVVSFTAPCPACGRDCEWRDERLETRLTTSVLCPC